MCHCLEVSPSGYYAWRNRGMSETQKRREELAIFVTYFFNDSKQTYGYRRVHKVLERNGVATSPETVRRLMRQEGLVACQPRPKARTTVPAADLAGRPDLIERNFTADAPARKLVGDITYIHTREGFVYLATVTGLLLEKNCWLRHDGTHANRIGPKRSAKLAVRNCPPIKGVTIFHSDRGSQYTSADYTATMNKYGFLASVGRTGVCYDNAAAESFNATCKKELVNRKIYHTRRKAIKEVTSWIEH